MLLRIALALVSFLSLSACAAPPDVGPPERAAGAPPVELRASPPRPRTGTPSAGRWLAATADGSALALVDAGGTAVATSPLPDGFTLRDVVVDPAGDRALIFAADLDDVYGEVLAVEVDGSGLGSPEHVAWIDGDARLAVTGQAIVAFEQSYGDAWKRLDAAGALLPRWPAPPPLSIGVGPGDSIDALLDDGAGGLSRVRADDDVSAWPPSLLDVGPAAVAPPVARLVEGEGGATWIFDGAGSALGVREASPGSSLVPLGVEAGAGELVSAIAFGCGARVALLLDDGTLLTLRLDAAGSPHEIAALPLQAPAPADASSLRVLARIGPTRLVVATSSGVLAVDVTGGTPTPDPGFGGADFRAPVAALP